MSEATIRAAIKAKLAAVSGIGVVHDYERWSRSWTRFLDLMRPSSSSRDVNGWMISRKQSPERVATPGSALGSGRTHDRTYFFEISGIYQLDDDNGSEITFQALIEAICTAFRADLTLGGVCQSTLGGDGGIGIQVREVDIDDFDNDTIYHTCTLDLTANERIAS